MSDRIDRLTTPEGCEKFVKNAVRLGRPDLAIEARKRAVELRATDYGSASQAERECLQAVYAYEEVLTKKNGRRKTASGIWLYIRRNGILAAAERAANTEPETVGYTALGALGLQDFAFEAVILRHASLFSAEAVKRCEARMKEWTSSAAA